MGNTARFVELATEFNQRMPGYVVERIAEALSSHGKQLAGAAVLVLEVSYKAETADCRHSPAIEIITRLLEAGARVQFHDPHVESIATDTFELEGSELTDELIESADLVLLHTSHSALDRDRIAKGARLIFDTRNFFGKVAGNIVKL
jgi:UDP-N-acetyl-D-glucosamine dehydrogenase